MTCGSYSFPWPFYAIKIRPESRAISARIAILVGYLVWRSNGSSWLAYIPPVDQQLSSFRSYCVFLKSLLSVSPLSERHINTNLSPSGNGSRLSLAGCSHAGLAQRRWSRLFISRVISDSSSPPFPLLFECSTHLSRYTLYGAYQRPASYDVRRFRASKWQLQKGVF